MVDALACEPQFLAHLAPVWRAMRERGTFYIERTLADQAAALGIEAVAMDAADVRRSARAPSASLADGPSALVASYGDVKVARRLGYRRFAFLEHGIGQSYGNRHGSYAGGKDREDCTLILAPNETCAATWQAAYPAARVEVVGSTRVKYLPQRTPGQPFTVAISFHWPAVVHPYAGTAFDDYNRVLPLLAERHTAIGHSHPKGDWPERMERRFRQSGIEYVRDFDEVCRRADLYIADNTSSLYEFAATGRPVVVLNARSWTRDVDLGLRFWDAAAVGPVVDPVQRNRYPDTDATAARLFDAIEAARRNDADVRVARELALGVAFAGLDGDVLAAEAVMDWAAAPVAVAA